MSDDDLFDAVKTDDETKRPEETGGETLFDDRTAFGGEAAESPETAEPAEDAKIVDATPKPKESTTVCEVPVETAAPRPAQELPHAASLGASLVELRKRCGLSLRQAAEESRIKEHYIEALEADRLADLPQLVFVIGFVKRLCVVYGVNAEDAESLVAELHDQLAYEIPEDINKSVICREQDEETRRKLQQITIGLIAGAALIVLLLLVGVTTLIMRAHKSKSVPKEDAGTVLREEWLAKNRGPMVLKTTRTKEKPPRR